MNNIMYHSDRHVGVGILGGVRGLGLGDVISISDVRFFLWELGI